MLSVHLANIKSSGVYRFVFDKSEVTTSTLQTLRLVVGYSEKGPFNTVTYVKNEDEFKEIYGNPSKKLERYGCYFHRLALQCLAKAPILCLNLKDFSGEKVDGYSFNFINKSDKELTASDLEIKSIFNTNRLWTLDPEVLPSAFSAVDTNISNYFYLVTTDTKKTSCTVFIRPSLEKGYDVTLRDWYNNYNNGDYPEYMHDYLDTMVSDYMLDAYIFRGKFDTEIATSNTFRDYFTIKKDEDGNSTVYVKDYIVDAMGNKIDALEALTNVTGSGFITKYTGVDIPYFKDTDGTWLSLDLMINSGTDTHNLMAYFDEDYLNETDVDGTYKNAASLMISGYNSEKFGDLGDGSNFATILSSTKYGTDNTACYMYNVWKADGSGLVLDTENSRNDFTYGDPALDFFTGVNINPSNASGTGKNWIHRDANDFTKFTISVNTQVIQLGDRFIAMDENKKINGLATVIFVEPNDDNNGSDIVFDKTPFLFCNDDTNTELNNVIIRYNGKLSAHAGTYDYDEFDNMSHKGIYLEGYTYENSKPVNTSTSFKNKWINNKLNVLCDKGIYEALINCTDTDYRYIVDTFEAFPEDGLRHWLSYIAKNKKNAFVISNFPAMKTLIKDGSWSDSNGFNTKYIVTGNNRAKQCTSRISLPSEVNGAAYIAFFTPLKFNENGLKVDIPSAGLVSNNFIEKYLSRQPYYIVAGSSYGKMDYEGLIGPDYNFTREDLDNLEPMGVNCMVYRPQRGTFINSNQTAKQNPVSGMSKINIVELVIYLQDVIANMLQGYQWELNTQALRDSIKAKADAICEQVKSNGGIYAYKNTCDTTNNTPEVIDNEMVVLSTAIEPAKGAGKMVHELTIYRTGQLSVEVK